MKYIICHYGEIALKGRNRKFFEETLVKNIKLAIKPVSSVKRISGRIIIKIDKELSLDNVFGLTHYSYAQDCKQDIGDIKEKALEILKHKEFNTFRISAQRSEKQFPLTSQQINEQVGEYIIEKMNKKVNLKNPDITLYIEIVEKYCFMYTEKKQGLGGLPVGVSGKAVSLISGGIDSPVASFLAMKRGLNLTYVHFHSMPFSDQASIDKVKDIANILNKFQKNSTMYLIPFADIQKEILLKTPQKLRVLLYRRMMIRIAEQIAIKEKCKSIVTGENLAQVASQTIENLTVIEKASDLIVLRPVLTMDKQEIIEKARELNTYETSIIPHHDCCARFLPKHPETRATIKEIQQAETKLDIQELTSQATKKALFYSCL